MTTTRFSGIKLGPPIEVFALQKAFVDDPFDKKVSLTIGGEWRSDLPYPSCTSYLPCGATVIARYIDHPFPIGSPIGNGAIFYLYYLVCEHIENAMAVQGRGHLYTT